MAAVAPEVASLSWPLCLSSHLLSVDTRGGCWALLLQVAFYLSRAARKAPSRGGFPLAPAAVSCGLWGGCR